ncbi:MAG: hypothetical protein ACFE9Q_12425 [Candidatus Hodarchaeota archaeon]
MDEEENKSKLNDHDPTIISSEDQEIMEQRPPNDKIIYYKLVEDIKDTES